MEFSYGFNPNSSKPVVYDREDSDCSTMGVFGISGTGKTYFMKREIMKVLSNTNDMVFVVCHSHYGEEDITDYHDVTRLYGGTYLTVNPYELSENSLVIPDNTRLVVFDIKFADDEAFSYCYSLCLEAVWDKVTAFKGDIHTHLYLDDIDPFAANESVLLSICTISKRGKHYANSLTYSAQDAVSLKNADFGKTLLTERTGFAALFCQFSCNQDFFKETFGIPSMMIPNFIHQPVASGLFLNLGKAECTPMKCKL